MPTGNPYYIFLTTMPSIYCRQNTSYKLVDRGASTTMKKNLTMDLRNYKVGIAMTINVLLCGGQPPIFTTKNSKQPPTMQPVWGEGRGMPADKEGTAPVGA